MDPPPVRPRKQDLVRRRDLPWGKGRKPDFPQPGCRGRHGSFLLRDFRCDSHFRLFLAWNHDLRSARQPAQVEDTSLPYRFLCLLSLATAVVASLANYGLVQILNLAMNRQALQPSFSKLLLSFFLLLMSSLIYCLIGSGIGFLLMTTAASIFAYLGIMWGIPVLSMISGVFSSSLMQKTLTATPAYVTVHLAPSDKWATSLLILFLWGLACQVAGTLRFRRYKA